MTSNSDIMGLRRPPYAFTEQGVAMLSAVLKSDTAVKVSIRIMNAFVSMRHFLQNNAEIFVELKSMRQHQINPIGKLLSQFAYFIPHSPPTVHKKKKYPQNKNSVLYYKYLKRQEAKYGSNGIKTKGD